MAPRNDGTKLERKVQEALKAYCDEHPALWYRFPDTKAARNIITNQPGDFLFTFPGTALLLECKSTNAGETLWDLLDPRQIAKHRLWHRAGHPTVFIYGDMTKQRVTAYRGDIVVRWVIHQEHTENPTLVKCELSGIAGLLGKLVTFFKGKA